MTTRLAIDGGRIGAELATLARMTDEPAAETGTAVTRVLFTKRDMEARGWLKGLAREAGLLAREDAVGNLFFRLEGEDSSLPAVATGSHTDAIPHAGMYDGTVGVLGGLEALRAIARSGVRCRRSIELVILTAEEPTRFGIGCLGSRMLVGALDAEVADAMVDREGHTLREVRRAAGCAGELSEVQLEPGHWSAWVELHIEQGPRLERAGCALGVVTGIAAPASLRYTVHGEGGHAGALLMPARRDALCAAAELVLQVENAARRSGSTDTVATVGRMTVFPGAENSVPSRVELSLDLRDTEAERRDRALRQIRTAIERIEADRGVRIEECCVSADAPVTCEPKLLELLERSAAERGASAMRMVSRAYHDTLFVARVAPVAMLFVPCRGGVSHRPDEWASGEAIALGTAVLADTLLELAMAGPATQEPLVRGDA